MRARRYKSFIILGLTALLVLGLSSSRAEGLRGGFSWVVGPIWRSATYVTGWVKAPYNMWATSGGRKAKLQQQIATLQLENQRLQAELNVFDDLDCLLPNSSFQSVAGRVIYRDPATWNSSLWVNLGTVTNEKYGATVIKRNSPVVIGDSIVGIVDYVGRKQSRVRLITDSGVTPSVRSVRDGQFLAKGELHGAGSPLWRTPGTTLKGVGFNLDTADELSGARDLRSGAPVGSDESEGTPIIQKGDLLVTTGMDGIFPPGLKAAKVTKVHMLQEGAYSYDIVAKPTAGQLLDLSLVFVIPAIGFDQQDQGSLAYETPELAEDMDGFE